jgi:hypothetical protein
MVEFAVHAPTAAAYFVAALVMALVIRRPPPAVRRYSYLVLAVVVVSALGATLQAFDVGNYESALDQPQSIPQLIDDSIAYAFLFALMTYSAGASRGMILLVSGLSVGSRVAIELGGFLGGGVLLAGLLFSIGSYLVRVYLLWWPVWRTAQTQPERRRLLYWKGRNTLMLLIGVNILAGIMSATLFDRFVQLVVLEYVNFMLRVGFAGFLLANVTTLAPDRVAETL